MSDHRAKLILGVDDDPATLAMLNVILTTAGYQFVGAASGEQALELVARSEPDLILLDVEMPLGIDGYETCRRMRKNLALRDTPILFLTARKTQDDVLFCVNAGGDDFVVKPIDRMKLQTRIVRWLARARSTVRTG